MPTVHYFGTEPKKAGHTFTICPAPTNQSNYEKKINDRTIKSLYKPVKATVDALPGSDMSVTAQLTELFQSDVHVVVDFTVKQLSHVMHEAGGLRNRRQ